MLDPLVATAGLLLLRLILDAEGEARWIGRALICAIVLHVGCSSSFMGQALITTELT